MVFDGGRRCSTEVGGRPAVVVGGVDGGGGQWRSMVSTAVVVGGVEMLKKMNCGRERLMGL